VPFATRFGRTTGLERATLFLCLLLTVGGTIMLMAPSVYHRLRWGRGGKSDVILVAHRLFMIGTGLLAAGIVAAVFLVASVLYGTAAAAVSAGAVALTVGIVWYVLPRERSRRPSVRDRE
jgi:Family of unknown function (DUF6328)